MKPTAIPADQAAAKALRTGLRRVPAPSSKEALEDAGVKAVRPSVSTLNDLWLGMLAAFGHRWATVHGDSPIGEDGLLTLDGSIWQRGLTGISDDQVREGFERCLVRADDWPPTLPAFRSLALGVPSLAQVKGELHTTQTQQERSRFTRLVWQYVDSFRFARADTDTAERIIREAYELAHEYVMLGGPIPQGSLAIGSPPPEPRTAAKPETVAECVARIHDAFKKASAPETTPAEVEGIAQ